VFREIPSAHASTATASTEHVGTGTNSIGNLLNLNGNADHGTVPAADVASLRAKVADGSISGDTYAKELVDKIRSASPTSADREARAEAGKVEKDLNQALAQARSGKDGPARGRAAAIERLIKNALATITDLTKPGTSLNEEQLAEARQLGELVADYARKAG